ncbi:ABC transporter ATP-binding protein [Candidatus Cyanaurora vandensis]|uniref:ABC transporter ATP-binding protein n=1 Tax=Candidatus Cyanaurora vandensis TaxID=2714958 RepID=UPI00257EB48E|nr:ABC transporter ATP-binding protein [Candidatus Cyanaurora vandensis]
MQSITSEPTTATRPASLALAVQGLGKQYRTGFWLNRRVDSLKDCTLSVYQGETFGLLGPNGAGKTTLMKVLLGIVPPTTGSGTVLGQPLGDQEAKKQVGYLPENPYFYEYLSGTEVLVFTARLFGLDTHTTRARIPELLAQVGLSEEAGAKQLRKYSKGMLQRIGLAQALVNNPQLVFLDEPMSGLDPMGRFQMRELVLSLKRQGKTVFFNSHILSDVEQICDRVGILAQGELVALGSLDELLGVKETYHAHFRCPDQTVTAYLTDLEPLGDSWQGVLKVDPAQFLNELTQAGGVLLELKLQRPSLETFFVERVGNRATPR